MTKNKDAIDLINQTYFSRYDYQLQLAEMIKQKMKELQIEGSGPTDYCTVTDLANPKYACWKRISPNVPLPPEILKKLNLGKYLQGLADIWFRSLPEFVNMEVELDGSITGIGPVVGRLDYYLKDSIVEFKTKEIIPETTEQIWELYPQDLEQLITYISLCEPPPKINFLVYMQDHRPYNLRVWKITFSDINKIRDMIKSRISMLLTAYKDKSPALLNKKFRCRYFKPGCKYGLSSTCDCAKSSEIDMTELKKYVTMIEDPSLLAKLETARGPSFSDFYATPSHILTPRKRLLDKHGCERQEWIPQFDAETACIRHAISELQISKIDNRKSIKDTLFDPRMKIGFRWLNLPNTIRGRVGEKTEAIPYVIKAYKGKRRNYPNEYHRAELGVIAASYGKNNGLIIEVYPEDEKAVQVFKITYKNIEKLKEFIKTQMDLLERGCSLATLAEANSIIDGLTSCPE